MRLDKYIEEINKNKEYNRRYAVKRFKLSYQTAEDIHQDTIMHLLERDKDSFDSNRDFAPWYFTIFKNKILDYIRKRNIEYAVEFNDDKFSIYNNKNEDYIHEQVRKSIDRLDQKFKAVIKMYYWDEMNQTKIGEEIGIDRSTVSLRLINARKKLMEQLSRIIEDNIN